MSTKPPPADSRSPSVQPCNFRYAGRLSNENARTLTTLHEKLAVSLANALEVFLGASLSLKLLTLEQMTVQDYARNLAANTYLLPCALNVMESSFLLQIDVPVVVPMIDLLLGGPGLPLDDARELTDIDEEIMQSVSVLVVQQVERSWRIPDLTVTPSHPIKPVLIPQAFAANEKLVLLTFEMEAGGATGQLKLVLPTPFVGFLLRHLRAAQSRKRLNLRHLPNPSLRERILDCSFLTSVDITRMRVLVRDLVDLKPGLVLPIKAPVKFPGHLTVEDVDVFDATPARSGPLKAAQIIGRSPEPVATKD